MKIKLLEKRSKTGYTTFGSVYAAGELPADGAMFSLSNERGEHVPMQSRITAIWPDGSVKWAAHTARAESIGEQGELSFAIENSKSEQDENCKIETAIEEDEIVIDTGKVRIDIPINGKMRPNFMAELVTENGRRYDLCPVLKLEEKEYSSSQMCLESCVTDYYGKVTNVEIVEKGSLMVVVKFDGVHVTKAVDRQAMPFQVFMYCYQGSSDIKFTHTFFYDGEADRDYIKGFGIRVRTRLLGNQAQRMVFADTDKGLFEEASALMFSNRPKLAPDFYEKQIDSNEKQDYSDKDVSYVLSHVPVWDKYTLVQDSAYHYKIEKSTGENFCRLKCREGSKAAGFFAVTGRDGGVVLGIRDMWQKHPSGFEVADFSGEETGIYAWFYSPEAVSYDFRHYDDRSYPDTLYEGFEHVDASAYGIAVTSELKLSFVDDRIPDEQEFERFKRELNSPSMYVLDPEYYHEKRAFGYWSLPSEDTEVLKGLENELKKVFDFYQNETAARDWYGLFDYGDVMHKYDTVRHTWRYDMGGYAWQNTELAPTYLLWYSFLRSGSGEVFNYAEAMSRHCSEVDMYHLGYRRGIGTRHNVRHWGCSCKEPRISMAGHYRFYYYLTGDYRMGEVLTDSRDAEQSMKKLVTSDVRISESDGKEKLSIRSGPDWTSFVANWMTEYERTGDRSYLDKIQNGIGDIFQMPFGLASGPEYLLELESGHLEYTGEHEDSINMHLQVCQGGTQIWLELLGVLACTEGGDNKLRKLLADYGSFYMLTKEEKEKATDGKIVQRPFSFPYFASALASFSAYETGNNDLSKLVIKKILYALYNEDDIGGFDAISYGSMDNGMDLMEIPWISTNFTSQWGLNMIVILEFLREFFPKTDSEMKKLLKGAAKENFHLA